MPAIVVVLCPAIFFSSLVGAEILEPGSEVVKVFSSGRFTEGPVVDSSGNLFFSDSGRVMRLLNDGNATEYAKPTGSVNGMMFDTQGRLYLCQNRGHCVSRLINNEQLKVLANACDGFPLVNPNDIAIDQQGRIFFTDTSFKHGTGDNLTQSGVLRIDPDGKCVLLVDNLRTPNGIIISPDDRYIFVADRGTQKLHRYTIQPDGSLQPDRIVYDFTPDRGIDGMCIDVHGNIYGAAGRDQTTGLFVISPLGQLLLHHPLPDFATNTTFGGEDLRDLYVTASSSVYRFRTVNEGSAPPLHKSQTSFATLPDPARWIPHAWTKPSSAKISKPEVKQFTNSIGMKLVRIGAGEFTMGSPIDEKGRQEDEQQHRVQISQPFYLGAQEVTQQEYQQVMNINPSHFSKQGVGRFVVAGMDTNLFPVERVSRLDAMEFCRKLSETPQEKAAGRFYRLPTEAEWEFACRSGSTSAMSTSSAWSSHQANFNGTAPYGDGNDGPFLKRPTNVGSYPSNQWLIHDMHGNVWEWCLDPYDASYYKNSPADNPRGPSISRLGIIRGGSWVSAGSTCRSANRHFYEPESRNGLIGFRVVCQP